MIPKIRIWKQEGALARFVPKFSSRILTTGGERYSELEFLEIRARTSTFAVHDKVNPFQRFHSTGCSARGRRRNVFGNWAHIAL